MEQIETIILISIILLCLVLSIVAILLISKTRTQLMRSIGLINDLHEHLKSKDVSLEQLELLGEELNQNMASQALEIEKVKLEVNDIMHSIDKLSANDPVIKMYTKATKMVDAGESVDDIIAACGLPRAEIDVLVSMRKKK